METVREPQIRARIQHTHTLKDGWRLAETTVEYSGTVVDWEHVRNELRLAHTAGLVESETRNRIESGS